MEKQERVFPVVFILLIALPFFTGYTGYEMKDPEIWILSPEQYDENVALAVAIMTEELQVIDVVIHRTTLEGISTVPQNAEVLVIIGHGGPAGLESEDGLIDWDSLYADILCLQPQKTMVLACDAPTVLKSNIYGFPGMIDAEAGALLTVWQIMMSIIPEATPGLPINRVINSQRAMRNPLSSAIYFVHGYFGSDTEWVDMATYLAAAGELTPYTYADTFDYFEDFPGWNQNDVHNIDDSISTFAINFANKLISSLPANTQVDIVAHSMGGLIVREMIRLRSAALRAAKIGIGTVITLGTPHYGTWMALPATELPQAAVNLWFALHGQCWWSPTLYRMLPTSYFLSDLNGNPATYGSGIDWNAIAGANLYYSLLMWDVHEEYSDGIVPVSSALPSFSGWELGSTTCFHPELISDPTYQRSYSYVAGWLHGSADSDNDDLLDGVERFVYSTDPYDADSDNDGLEDGDEVLVYGTNPANSNTDGDALTDGVEVAWGYSPTDVNSPIPASSLIYSATYIGGSKANVYINYYTPMSHIKVYVKYYWGSWGSYILLATIYGYPNPNYGTPSEPRYRVTWYNVPSYATRFQVKVEAYHASLGYLGSDSQIAMIPGGGGPGPD